MKFIEARDIKIGDELAHTLDNGETVLKRVTKVEGVEMNTKMVSFSTGEPEFIEADQIVAIGDPLHEGIILREDREFWVMQ